MGQFVFLALFIITLLAGVFAYLKPPAQGPMKFVLSAVGFTGKENHNRANAQQVSMTVDKGMMKIREQMATLAQQQNSFQDMLKDRQEVLERLGQNASEVMSAVDQASEKSSQDILRLKTLMTDMQDQRRLLVERGQDLMAQNNDLAKSREWIQDQINFADFKKDTTLSMLQDRYGRLSDQAQALQEQGARHSQMVREEMLQMRDHLNEIADSTKHEASGQQQVIKERMAQMLEKQKDDMLKLEASEEKARNLMRETKENLLSAQQRFDDMLMHSKTLIADARQRSADQAAQNKQRMADQMQTLKDRANTP